MNSAPLPESEAGRRSALAALEVLDSRPEEQFDSLVRAASLVCAMPISLITLVDADRLWFKANLGLHGLSETPRDPSFCAHAILSDDLFIVPDTLKDVRFANNPLVQAPPNIRFYAGVPLVLSDGHRMGTLCVLDHEPRQLNTTQYEVLRCLAFAAVRALESRQREQTLSEQSRRLKYIIEATGAATWEWNVQTGEAQSGELWSQILGKVIGETSPVTMQTWAAHAHPEDTARAEKLLNEHLAGRSETYECETRARHKNGHWVWVLNRGRLMTRTPDGKPEWVFGTCQDITERKHQEEALRRSETLLDRTGQIAGIGGWQYDVNCDEIIWSKETYRIYGVDPTSRPTRGHADTFYTPEAKAMMDAAAIRGLTEGTGWDFELQAVRTDGSPIWVRSIGAVDFEDDKPVRIMGALQDITQRKDSEREQERLTERVRLATEAGVVGIWEWLIPEDEFQTDEAMRRLFGIEQTPGGLSNDVWSKLIHPDDIGQVMSNMRACLGSGASYDAEYRIIWPSGETRYLHARGTLVRDARGEPHRMVGTNWDVTEIKRLTVELGRKHELLRVTLQSIGDGVITTDFEGRISWMNPVAERMTGWAASEAERQPLAGVFNIVNEETRQPTQNPVIQCLAHGRVVGLTNHTLLISRNGDEYGIEDSAAPIRDERGEMLGAVLVFRDVTEQRRMSGEMTYRATHDVLTGLVNRAEFEVRLRRLLNNAHEDRSCHALLYIDLDQFKLVNDACGHTVGDQLLQQVAKLLSNAIRSRDTVARLGGDEFAVILDHCTAEQAHRVGQQICDLMDDFRFLHDGRRFRIGTSIGLVPVDDRWTNTAAILQAADTSCYAAKEGGRNRVHAWFDTDLALRARQGEMQWTTRIEQALDEDRFVLFGQRIMLLNGKAKGLHVEVLLRMQHDDGSLIAPGAFLPAAERFHLASRIDRWVLRQAVAWMKSLSVSANIEVLSVNLSGQSIGDRAFHRWAIDLLEEAGRGVCRKLCLEITETAAVTNMADARLFIEEVRRLGVKIALDDFGAGASSFGYLKMLPVDFLKIDGQFIRDVIDDPLDEAAVRSFVDVAKVVGVQTVAEFVDRQQILDRLRQMGVDFAQGFLLHRPVPLQEIVAAGELAAV